MAHTVCLTLTIQSVSSAKFNVDLVRTAEILDHCVIENNSVQSPMSGAMEDFAIATLYQAYDLYRNGYLIQFKNFWHFSHKRPDYSEFELIFIIQGC